MCKKYCLPEYLIRIYDGPKKDENMHEMLQFRGSYKDNVDYETDCYGCEMVLNQSRLELFFVHGL